MTMNQINQAFVEMLKENGIETPFDVDNKKRQKWVLIRNIENIQCIAPVAKNHSERVTKKNLVSEKIEDAVRDPNLELGSSNHKK